MAEISTYVSSTEILLYYPEYANFSATEKPEALSASFSMLNGYLNPITSVPVVNPSGFLKELQARLCRYVLQLNNEGWSQELADLKASVKADLADIHTGMLSTEENQTFSDEVGWHLVSSQPAAGFVFIDPASPPPANVRELWTLTFTSANDSYPGTAAFSATSQDAATAQETGVTSIANQYVGVHRSNGELVFWVMLKGKFALNETVVIEGVPEKDVDSTTPTHSLVGTPISFNSGVMS